MSGVLFASPLPVAAIAASRGGGAGRLLTADPREAWIDSLVGAPVTFTLDLGTVRDIDCLFLGFTNAIAGATWSATGGLAHAGEAQLLAPTDFPVPGSEEGRAHGLALLPALATVRHLAITLQQPAGGPALVAGVLAIARALQPEWGHEWGGGRGLLDLAPVTRHSGGGFGVGSGARKATWQATLGDLSDAELADLWALARRHGESRPLLLVEEPSRTAGLADRMHWGKFDRIEPYERRAVGETRWGVRFEDWL